MDPQVNSVSALHYCSLTKILSLTLQFLKEKTFMLHNPLKSHRILVAGLASAALWLGLPRHAWSQG